MTKQDFLEQIYDILDENYYDNDATKWIVKECKSYYIEYKKRITIEKDRQLNQFSSIYFDKLKQNSEIYEK